MKLACVGGGCVCVCVCMGVCVGIQAVTLRYDVTPVACSQADQRDNGQEVWWSLACSGGGGLHNGDHVQPQEHPLHVLWRHAGHLCVEVYMKGLSPPTHCTGTFLCYNIHTMVYCTAECDVMMTDMVAIVTGDADRWHHSKPW